MGMAEYQSSEAAKYDMKYHMVWTTKCRYEVLRGEVAERARELIRQPCQMRELQIVRGAISAGHVHMLASAPPKLLQYVNGRSSRRLPQEYPHWRKGFWGHHLWARGYSRATVGAVNERTVREYIESQKWDEDVEGFKITAPELP